jgi:Arc/MetJ family transcription regulator
MRTTIDINDALLERVKKVMIRKKLTMRALVEDGLRRILADEENAQHTFRLRDASVDGDGWAKGFDSLDWEKISPHLYTDEKDFHP